MSRETQEIQSIPPPSISEALDRAEGWFLMLDFDGTVAPIVDRPDLAKLPDSTRAVLQTLAENPNGKLAILSGRSLEDVRSRVGLDSICYAGNHGFEIAGPGIQFEEPTALSLRDDLAAMTAILIDRLGEFTGVVVESKGLTTTVHNRLAPLETHEAIARIVAETVTPDDARFDIRHGKKILEIRPSIDWDKGRAAHYLIDALEARAFLPIFLGDDRTDEDAFLALPEGITIHVGEGPTAARYRVPDVPAVEQFLVWMASR